jgi:hypothetical protein
MRNSPSSVQPAWLQARRLMVSLPSRLLRQWPAWLYLPAVLVALVWSALSAVISIPPPRADMLGFKLAIAAFVLHVPWMFFIHEILRIPTTLPIQGVPDLVAAESISAGDSFVLFLRGFAGERRRDLQRKTRERQPRLVRVRIAQTIDYFDDPGGTEEYCAHAYEPLETELSRVLSGRVVALVNNDDPAPPEGIRFVAVNSATWEVVARRLIQHATCIVFCPDGGSGGVERECALVSSLGAEARTVVVSKAELPGILPMAARASPNATSLGAAISKIAPGLFCVG